MILLLLINFLISDIYDADIDNSIYFSNKNLKNDETYLLDNSVIPDEYTVGPGDEFYINILSNNLIINEYVTISPMGDLILPKLGLLNISKLTLNESIDLVENTYKDKFENIKISTTLSKIRQFKVKVTGVKDGPYYIITNSSQRVSDIFRNLFENYQELTNNISRRNIQLYRNDNVDNIDIMSINMDNNSYNPYLIEEDVVHFSIVEETVSIYGGIKFPGTYEFKRNETLNEFINTIGGFSFDSDSTQISINRYVKQGFDDFISINNDSESMNVLLKPFDFINVNKINGFKKRNLVFIEGEVNIPGTYILKENMLFVDLLNQAGGYTQYADKSKILINNSLLNNIIDFEEKRIDMIPPDKRSTHEQQYLKAKNIINLGSVVINDNNANQVHNYILMHHDLITIPRNLNTVELIGSFNNPGRYPFVKNRLLKEYIKIAGGKAKNSNNKVYLIDSYNNKKRIKNMNYLLKNGDKIFIEEKSTEESWNNFKEILTVITQAATFVAVIDRIND